MSRYPVFKCLSEAGNTGVTYERSKRKGAADLDRAYKTTIKEVIRFVFIELGDKVNIPTDLVMELKLAEELNDKEIREQIAEILFGFIVYPVLNKWLYVFLSRIVAVISHEDFEDLIGDAILKICEMKYDDSICKFLAWTSVMAKWPWIDQLRKDAQMAKYDLEFCDWDTLDEYQLSAPDPLDISEETKELLLSAAKNDNEISVLKAVFAGIPWDKTKDIVWWTGLSSSQVNHAKFAIKKAANISGSYESLQT